MRFIALAVIIALFPVALSLLRQNKDMRKWAYLLLGLLPFTGSSLNFDASLIAWPLWPGYVRGTTWSVVDSIALALLVVTWRPKGRVPLLPMILAYGALVLASALWAETYMATLFYVVQWLRVIILFLAVVSVMDDERAVPMIYAGMSFGLAFQFFYALSQRASGVLQAGGSLGHQNTAGMMAHFAIYPCLALLAIYPRAKAPLLGVAGGLGLVVLTASRATIGFAGLGVVLLLLLLILRRPTKRVWQMVGLGAAAIAIATPVALMSLEKRFASRPADSGEYDERAAFERAAKLMIADYPAGVGANQYVVVANVQGYSARGGVAWNSGSRSTNVHNFYLLTTAELGWLGLIAFSVLMFSSIQTALSFAFSDRVSPRVGVVLGQGVTLMMVALHSLFEWIFVTAPVQMLFAICLGVVAGSIRQHQWERRMGMAAAHRAGPMAPQLARAVSPG